MEVLTDIKIILVDHITRDEWLSYHLQGNSKFLAFIIAATIWQILKGRCDCVFRQENHDVFKIANLVVHHVKVFSICSGNYKMQNYLLKNRPKPGYTGIFSAAAWNVATCKGSLGFILLILMLMFVVQDLVQVV